MTVGYVIAGVTATADADFDGPLPSGNLTGTLQFGGGVMSRTLEIPILQDSNVESNETFTVTLQNAQGGASVGIPSLATVTIVDDDRVGTIQFSQATATAQEDTSVSLTVTRTGSTSQGASVGYAITGDTASVDQAVTPLTGTVTFLSGQGSRPLPIKLSPDGNVDGKPRSPSRSRLRRSALPWGRPTPPP